MLEVIFVMVLTCFLMLVVGLLWVGAEINEDRPRRRWYEDEEDRG